MRPCPKCNQINPAEASFCLKCAAILNDRQSYGQAAHSPGGPFIGQTPGHASNSERTPPLPGFQNGNSGQSQKGLFAMILAIVSLLCCGPFTAIPAAILGWMELDSIKNGRSPASNKTMALVGLWGGIVAGLIHIIFYFLWIALSALSSGSDPYNPYGY